MKTKINKIKSVLAFCCLLGVLSACEDYLDRKPISDITPENYLWDEAHLEAYASARYAFRSADLYYDDTHTDNQSTRSAINNRFVPGQWKVPQQDGDWNFKNIYQVNYFLETVIPRWESGKITGNLTMAKHYIGEMYFLRANEYFEKLKLVGDFPIITTTLPDKKDALVEASKRMPRTEVARFILNDLDMAISMLSENPDGGSKNRISLNVAHLLRSRVALFEGTWLKHHKNTALVPNGPGWPGKEKDYNKSYQFQSGSIDNEIDYFLSEAMKSAKIVADKYSLVPNNKVITKSLADPKNPYFFMFSDEDLKGYSEVMMWRAYSIPLNIMHGTNHNLQYNGGGNGYNRQYVDAFLMENGLPIYATGSQYAGDDYIDDVKKNRDWRLQLFMKAPGEVLALQNVTSPIYEVYPKVYVSGSDTKNNYATGYAIKKGLSYDYNQQIVNLNTVGIIIFRAAEAYLNYLEACYEKTGAIDASADNYWRALRTRAGVDPDYTKTIAATNMNKEKENDWGAYSAGNVVDATLYNIRRERRCEFIADGMRYPDLIRWRAMDQLNGFQLEGFKLWGPMKDWYTLPDKSSYLSYGNSDPAKNNVSSPNLSNYLRILQVNTSSGNLVYNGYKWCEAHYLSPIAIQHFLVSASDGKDIASSPIYQNPGWPTTADQGPIGY